MAERIQQCVDTSLFGQVCDYCDGGAIFKVLAQCIQILTILIGALAVLGIIIAGIMYMTSSGDVARQTKAKRRLLEIVVGLLCYGTIFAFMEFIIPGGIIHSTLDETTTSCPEEEEPVNPPGGGGGNPPGGGTTGMSCSENPNTVEIDGYCYAKTNILATDYVRNACSRYHSCQSYKPEWSSSCEAFARINAKEMMYGNPIVHESIGGGAVAHKVVINARTGEDSSPLLCNGSIHSNSTGRSVSRIAFKKAVKVLVEQIMSGKPVTIAAANKTLGKWADGAHWNRHFITMVGVSSFVNATNVDQIEITFEDGKCMNGGNGHYEPYDQPHIKLNGREVQFKYVDPWGATLKTTGVSGQSRVWRYHYEREGSSSDGWYIFTY